MTKPESDPMPFVMGQDGQEAIVFLEEYFQLVQKRRMDYLGKTKSVARIKLIDLGKESNFPQFKTD